MDRLTELDNIEKQCTEWLNSNLKAPYEKWKVVSDQRLCAMREKTEIFQHQLANVKRRNGKDN